MNEELQLSKTEFDLLELLVRNVGIALDHSTVYERIWGYDFGPDSKNLPVYIGYLRRKLTAAGAPPLIHTLRGVGYTLRPSARSYPPREGPSRQPHRRGHHRGDGRRPRPWPTGRPTSCPQLLRRAEVNGAGSRVGWSGRS
jgi:DNA-binding winged helix-turn-helix (wHTH) protein